jgi:hypothetical protein
MQRDFDEQADGLLVPWRVVGGAELGLDGVRLLVDDPLDEIPGDRGSPGEGDVVVQPLPDLRAGGTGQTWTAGRRGRS